MFNQLWRNCNEIKRVVDKLLHIRSKRGLINALGRTIKFITGNLDDEDKQSISQNLNHLFSNQQQIKSKLQRFTTFANHITEQYDTEFNQLHAQINSTLYFLSKLETGNEINLMIQNEIFYSEKFLHTVRVIERTITLAFNDVINLELFTFENLQTLYNNLNSTYEPQELVKLDLLHPFQILEFAKFHIIHVNDSLAFILKLPILSRHIYQYARIYPIPNNNNKILVPEKLFHLTNENQELWTNNACQRTDEVIFCSQTLTKGCNLLRKPKCPYAEVTNQYEVQTPLDDDFILLSSNKPQEVIENCGSRPNRQTFIGSYIVAPSCTTIIGTTTYAPTKINLTLEIPNVKTVEGTVKHRISLKSIHLRDSKQLQTDLRAINEDGLILHPVTVTHYFITSLLLILAVIATIIIWKNRLPIRDRLFRPKPVITLESMRELLQPNHQMNEVVHS